MKKLRDGYLLSNPRALALLKAADAAGRLLFALRSRRRPPPDIRKVLIAKIDHLGDVLLSLHLLPAVRQSLPGCEIHFLAASWSRDILEGHPDVARVLLYDDFRLNRSGSRLRNAARSCAHLLQFVRAARREKYDLALDLRAYYPNAIPALALSGSRCRIGYATGGFGFLLDASPAWREGVHETEHFYDLWRCAFPRAERAEADFSYLADGAAADSVLAAAGCPARARVALVHAFCQRSFLRDQKHWQAGEWKKLIAFLEKEGYHVVCSGDEADEPLVRSLVEGSRALNLAGATPMRALAGLMRRAEHVFSVDTFAAHLSAALGARTWVLFNGVEPVEQWKPWGPRVRVFPIESRARELEEAIRAAAGEV